LRRKPTADGPGLPLLAPSKNPLYSIRGETRIGNDLKAAEFRNPFAQNSWLTNFYLLILYLSSINLDYSGKKIGSWRAALVYKRLVLRTSSLLALIAN
jgi:hypothetical protein